MCGTSRKLIAFSNFGRPTSGWPPVSSLIPGVDKSSPSQPAYGTLTPMGSKDKGKKEAKKAPKPKPKPEPGRKREGFTPAPPK
jgi:hypothetical protein